MNHSTDQFDFIVQEIAAVQPRLYAFVRTLICDPEQAHDVLQEVNLVLWQKRAEFDASRDFGYWACGVARFQVMAFLRDQGRDKLLFFDEQLLSQVADQATTRSNEIDQRTRALRFCLKKLSEDHQQLIQTRYSDQKEIKAIAQNAGKTPGAITKALFRVRRTLLKCIMNKITMERHV